MIMFKFAANFVCFSGLIILSWNIYFLFSVSRTLKVWCSTTGPCSTVTLVQVQPSSPPACCSTTSPASSRPWSRSWATRAVPLPPCWGKSPIPTPTSRETPPALTDPWPGPLRCEGPRGRPALRPTPRRRLASSRRRRSNTRAWW